MAEQNRWTDDELKSSVEAYVEIRRIQIDGGKVNKADIYRTLAQQHGRSPKAFEYRLQNISHVYALMGRSWAEGLKPARNVGTTTAAKLEELIHITERTSVPPVVEFEQRVLEHLKQPLKDVPDGETKPRTKEVVSTQYIRDPKVVAWVLQEANGNCECCGSLAPFCKPSGDPYLEVHHLRRLADGGSDTPSNAVAICPNCHRELHHGQNQDTLRKQVLKKVSRLIPE